MSPPSQPPLPRRAPGLEAQQLAFWGAVTVAAVIVVINAGGGPGS